MQKEFLPIGTVVILNNAKKKMMISGYRIKDLQTKKVFDYVGCVYPEGFLNNTFSLFNDEDIRTIFYEGLRNKDYENYAKMLKQKVKDDSHLQIDTRGTENVTEKISLKSPTKQISKEEMQSKYATTKTVNILNEKKE